MKCHRHQIPMFKINKLPKSQRLKSCKFIVINSGKNYEKVCIKVTVTKGMHSVLTTSIVLIQ